MFSQFSHSVMSNSLRPHGLQQARPPCPSPTPVVYSNSCPSSQWCHPTISSSVVPFSSCPQSFPASGTFPVSQLFAWGGQVVSSLIEPGIAPEKEHFPESQEWGSQSGACGLQGWAVLLEFPRHKDTRGVNDRSLEEDDKRHNPSKNGHLKPWPSYIYIPSMSKELMVIFTYCLWLEICRFQQIWLEMPLKKSLIFSLPVKEKIKEGNSFQPTSVGALRKRQSLPLLRVPGQVKDVLGRVNWHLWLEAKLGVWNGQGFVGSDHGV